MAFEMSEKEQDYLIRVFIRNPGEYARIIEVLIFKIQTGQVNTDLPKQWKAALQLQADIVNQIKKDNPLQEGEQNKTGISTADVFSK